MTHALATISAVSVPPRAFAHIDTWVFDLDNTLYPCGLDLLRQMDERISDYIAKFLNTTYDEAFRKQEDFHRRYGATVRGMLIENFTAEGGQTGIWLEGEVFESYLNHPRMSWMRNAGIVCRHGYPEMPGVLSNIFIDQPDITRCPQNMGKAMGIFCDQACSVIITDGNFISLDGPGIKGTMGVKSIMNCEFENAGQTNGAAIELDAQQYFSQVLFCRGSKTNGAMKYLIRHGGHPDALDVVACRMYNGEIVAPCGE